jgi:hypothetical protein
MAATDQLVELAGAPQLGQLADGDHVVHLSQHPVQQGAAAAARADDVDDDRVQ